MKLLNTFAATSFTLLAAMILLSACGSATDTNSSSATEENSGSQRVLTDALDNEVTVPADPKRIIGSYLEDYLVALDVTPVAQWTVSTSIQDYLQEELAEVPTISYDLPYEEVLEYEPDLLLVSSSALVEGGKYAEYSKIAPTYVVKNGDGVTWRDQLLDIGTVLNKEDQAEEVLADYDVLAEETQEEIAEKVGKQSVAILWITNNQAFMVSENRSSGAVLYGDLGLEVPALVAEVSAEATADWSSVSLEKLAELDADNLFVINSDESEPFFQEEVWKNLPAVKNERVFSFGSDSTWLYNGPIANTGIIEDVKTSLLSE